VSEHQRLKLRAHDGEDVRVLSAVMQDALVPVRDMTYLPAERRFALVANRFRWELCAPLDELPDRPREPEPEPDPDTGDARFEDVSVYERVHAGLAVDGVEAAYYRGFSKAEGLRVLELLALMPDGEGMTLAFAGDAAVRLQGAGLVCHLQDLDEPWPTRWRPAHDPAGAAGVSESDNGGAASS